MRTTNLVALVSALSLLSACTGRIWGSKPEDRSAETAEAPLSSDESADVRIGTFELLGRDMTLPYEVVDGQKVFEGDIILGEEIDQTVSGDDGVAGRTSGLAATARTLLWEKGVVPYVIHSGLKNPKRVHDAIAAWHARTSIRLVRRTTQADYVEFVSGGGCSSYVGRRGGRQPITLHPNCGASETMHEIGHAVGLFHEHNRSDRNRHVRIHLGNVESGAASQFKTYAERGLLGSDIGPYDTTSIMHYNSATFSKNGRACRISGNKIVGCPVTITRINGAHILPNRKLSTGDAQHTNALYATAPGFQCWIHNASCTANPTYTGWFTDTHPPSSANQAACAVRAKQWAAHCKNIPGTISYSSYVGHKGQVLGSTGYRADGCRVSIPANACPNNPGRVGTFRDPHEPANANEATCKARAQQWANHCGTPAGTQVKTTFFAKNAERATSGYAADGCLVTLRACPAHPTYVGTVNDKYEGSNTNQARCERRAREFSVWCKNPAGTQTTATFYKNNSAQSTTHYAADGCIVDLRECKSNPAGAVATRPAAGDASEEACRTQAGAAARTCGNPGGATTSARFFSGGTSKTLTYKNDGCVVTQAECTAAPTRVGSFADHSGGAGTDMAACEAKAKSHAASCNNRAGLETQTVFYKGGDSVGMFSYAADGCLVDQPICAAYPDRVWPRGDDYDGSGTDEARCMKRAKEFAVWCENPPGTVSTSTFYTNNESVASEYAADGCLLKITKCENDESRVGEHPVEADSVDACFDAAVMAHQECGGSLEEAPMSTFFESGSPSQCAIRETDGELLCGPIVCGDGLVDQGEVCDDGPDNGDVPGRCNTECTEVNAETPPPAPSAKLGADSSAEPKAESGGGCAMNQRTTPTSGMAFIFLLAVVFMRSRRRQRSR